MYCENRKFFFRLFLGLLGLIMVLLMLYQIPGIKYRFGWRLDAALTYMRDVVNPIGSLPTAARTVSVGGLAEQTRTPNKTTAQVTYTSTLVLSPTETITPTALPSRVVLPAPEYEVQDWNNCGPATLSMYLRYYGWEGDQFDISDEIKPIRADRNVNIDELIRFVHENVWWLNAEFRVGGNVDMLRRFIAAGIPVVINEAYILEEGADGIRGPSDDRWTGHYLLVNRYDDAAQMFVGQDSFLGRSDRALSYTELDYNWQSFNRAFFLIYKPDQAQVVQSLLGDDWDIVFNREHALEVAQDEVNSDPQNPFAWFNLGNNLVYFDRYDEAIEAYDTAREIGLPQRMMRYQFGPFLAYFHAGYTDELLALTEYALEITPNSEEALLWRGWGLYRKGEKNEALHHFNEAIKAHPGYDDAIYALDFVRAN